MSDVDHGTPGDAASGGYRLFAFGGTSPTEVSYLATHFQTGEIRELHLSPPAGSALPGDYWNPPPIDARGRLLVTFHGTDKVSLQATADGSTWEPVGLPVTAAPSPSFTKEVGGAVIFDGPGGGGPQTPGALPSGASQLIGPQGGDGIHLVRWEAGAPDNPLYADDEISEDGACVAYFRSGTLRVVQTADYTASDLGLPPDGYSAEMAWIPLAD